MQVLSPRIRMCSELNISFFRFHAVVVLNDQFLLSEMSPFISQKSKLVTFPVITVEKKTFYRTVKG